MFRKQYIITAFLALTAVFSGCTNLDEEVFSSIPEKDFPNNMYVGSLLILNESEKI